MGARVGKPGSPPKVYKRNMVYLNVYSLRVAPGSYHTSAILLGYEVSFAADVGIWLLQQPSAGISSENCDTRDPSITASCELDRLDPADKIIGTETIVQQAVELPWATRFVESIPVGRVPSKYLDRAVVSTVEGMAITMGELRLMQLLNLLSIKYNKRSYHLIRLNCNDFCEELIQSITRMWPGFCHDVCLQTPRKNATHYREKHQALANINNDVDTYKEGAMSFSLADKCTVEGDRCIEVDSLSFKEFSYNSEYFSETYERIPSQSGAGVSCGSNTPTSLLSFATTPRTSCKWTASHRATPNKVDAFSSSTVEDFAKCQYARSSLIASRQQKKSLPACIKYCSKQMELQKYGSDHCKHPWYNLWAMAEPVLVLHDSPFSSQKKNVFRNPCLSSAQVADQCCTTSASQQYKSGFAFTEFDIVSLVSHTSVHKPISEDTSFRMARLPGVPSLPYLGQW